MKKLLILIISVLLCEGIGFLATPFTIRAIPTWYLYLHKPFFSPPNWVFGPVWTMLYFLIGISFFLVIQNHMKKKQVKIAVYYFLAQLLSNFLWSFLFFGLKSPVLGLIDILILLLLIVITMKQFLLISKSAFFLLIPYMLWVCFATALNSAIVILN